MGHQGDHKNSQEPTRTHKNPQEPTRTHKNALRVYKSIPVNACIEDVVGVIRVFKEFKEVRECHLKFPKFSKFPKTKIGADRLINA